MKKGRELRLGEDTGRTTGSWALLLGSEGYDEKVQKSSPEDLICGREERKRPSQGDIKSTRRREVCDWQGEPDGGERSGGLAVSWFRVRSQ